jgi:hypothetical protein
LIGKIENNASIISMAIQKTLVSDSLVDEMNTLDNEILSKIKDKFVEPIASVAVTKFNEEHSGIEINELCSAIDLMIEGAKQKHCVGGYFDAIKARKSFVFSVRVKHSNNIIETATLELRAKTEAFFINQMQGKAQRALSDDIKDVGKQFCEMCSQYVRKRLNIAIEPDRDIDFPF